MTKKKSAKRAFISSFMSFIMCFAMLAGTTFAWYTDSVTSSGNKIIAGTLDIELWMHDGNGYVDISNSSAPIFQSANLANPTNATLWEPGKTQVAYLMIKNAGDLDLKYRVALNVRNVAKNLYEVMRFKIVPDATPDSGVTSWTDTNPVADAQSVIVGDQVVSGTNFEADDEDASGVKLDKGDAHYFALLIHMDEEAGNEYMGGEVDFDLKVLATQAASESDSFDNTYDELLPFPAISTGSTTVEVNGAATVITAGGITIALPENTGDSANVYKLDVSDVDMATDDTTGEIEVEFDATLYLNNARVVSTAEGHIYAMSLDIPAGAELKSVKHNGNELTLANTGADQTYTYNQDTGEITIYSKSFSPFSVSYIGDLLVKFSDDSIALMSLADFRNSVNAGNTYEGCAAKLLRNVAVTDVWTPIGNTSGTPFKGSFDGGNFTISGLTDGSSAVNPNNDENALFGLFGYVQGTVKIENLVLTDVYANMPKATNGVAGLIASANTSGAPTYLTVKNVDVSGTLIGKDRVAGIVGKGAGYSGTNVGGATMSFTDCVNYASIEAKSTRAAGICAQEGSLLTSSSYVNCENAGSVICSGNRYGGIAAGIVAQVQRAWMPNGSDTIFTGTTPNYEVVDLYQQYAAFAAQAITKNAGAYTFSGLNGFTVTNCKNSGVVKTEYTADNATVHGIAADITTSVFEAPSGADDLPATTFAVLSNYFLLSSSEIEGYEHPVSYWKWADSRYHVMAGRVYDTTETYLFKFENGMWFTADEYRFETSGGNGGVLDYIASKSGSDYINTGYCVLQDNFTITNTVRLSGYYLDLNGHTLTLQAPILYQGGQGSFELKNGTIVRGSNFTTNAQNGYSVKLNDSEVPYNARIIGSYTANATEPFTYGTLTLNNITYKPGANCVIASHEPTAALTINLIECDIDGRIDASNSNNVTHLNVTKNNVATNGSYSNQVIVISGGAIQQQ